ncbi:hypothetical protein D3C79_650650 [compost metagenome]
MRPGWRSYGVFPRLGHGGGVQADQVVDQLYAFSGARQHAGKLFGFSTVDPATQRHHAFAAVYFYRGLLGCPAPQQPGLDDGGQGGILDTLCVSAQRQRTFDELGVDLQLVVDLFDAAGRQGHSLGQLALDFVFDPTGQPCTGAVHFNVDTKRVEHAIQGQGRLQGAFKARILDRIGLNRGQHRHQQGRQHGCSD